MIVVSGASGHTGSLIALSLLSDGKKVRVIGRHAEKLKPFTDKGAEALVGDLSDSAFLNKAYKDARAVYALIPPDPHSSDFRTYQHQIADNHLYAVRMNGVKHVVLLSSIGAHLRKGAGVVDGLGYLEEIFSALHDVNVLNLRPGYFMENVFGQLGTIKQMGITGSSIKPDLRFPIVATADIASVASRRLADLNFRGNTVEYVLGPADLSFNEITAIIGKAIDKPDLKYVQFSYDDATKAMAASGFVSENVGQLYNKMSEAFNNGSALNDYRRTPGNSTSTRFEDFVRGFAHAYKNA